MKLLKLLLLLIPLMLIVSCDTDVVDNIGVDDSEPEATPAEIDTFLKEEIDAGMEARAYAKKNNVPLHELADMLYSCCGAKNVWYVNFEYDNHGGTMGSIIAELPDDKSKRYGLIEHHFVYSEKIVDGEVFNFVGKKYIKYCLDCDIRE